MVRSLADRASKFGREESHAICDCPCYHCSTDRKVIEQATLPYLDDARRSAIELCVAMRAHLESVMTAADREAMTLAAQLRGLDDDQTQALIEHVRECPSTQNRSYDSAAMEEAIGAAAYCMANGREASNKSITSPTTVPSSTPVRSKSKIAHPSVSFKAIPPPSLGNLSRRPGDYPMAPATRHRCRGGGHGKTAKCCGLGVFRPGPGRRR